jgi:hypothetical protein
MNLDEALIIIKAACGDFKGTWADHQKIQAAVALVEHSLRQIPAEAAAPVPPAPASV